MAAGGITPTRYIKKQVRFDLEILIFIVLTGGAIAGYYLARRGRREREARVSMADWEDIWSRRIKRGK